MKMLLSYGILESYIVKRLDEMLVNTDAPNLSWEDKIRNKVRIIRDFQS